MRYFLPFKIFSKLFFYKDSLLSALDDYKIYKKIFKKKGNHIFIACFVKSGSTFLAGALAEITGFKRIYYSDFRGRTDHDIYFPALLNAYDSNAIVQQHARGTEMNLRYLKHDSQKAIVLVRNVFDALVSYRDHILNETHIVPFIYCREDFKTFSFDKQMDMVIENVGPWLINFYVSWVEAIRAGKIDAILIRYEDFIDKPSKTLSEILAHYNLSFSETQIAEKLEKINQQKKELRFNKGIQGRGEMLETTLKSKMHSLTKYYSDIDFSPIGL